MRSLRTRCPPRRTCKDKGLRPGALGLLNSIVVGVASTAPAYSLAATLGAVVVVVGLHAPAIMLLAFVPMLFIAVAYQQLNRVEPDCGTTFTWATKAFGPRTGWLGGWAIVAADVIVMANLAQVAGQYGFLLVGAEGLAGSTFWTTVAGIIWIAAMTAVCYLGIEISARVQFGLLTVEVVMLTLFAVVALARVWSGHGGPGSMSPSWSWFDPFRLPSASAFSDGILLAVFIYWGWDTAVSVNEETRDRARTPGRAAVVSTVLLLGVYAVVTTAALAFAGVGAHGTGLANPTNQGDVLSVLGHAVFGHSTAGDGLTKLLILMVLTSAAASTLTTILPTARTTLSMAVYRAIPSQFGRIHPRYLTPTWSTIGMGLASVAFYGLMVAVSQNILGDTIASLGLMIAFYYGMTGFAAAWYFRRDLANGWRDLVLKGVLPVLGGLMLLAAFAKSAVDYAKPDYGSTSWTLPTWPHWHLGGVFLTGIGAVLVGAVLMLAYERAAPAFFRGQVLRRDTPVLVPSAAVLSTGAAVPEPRAPSDLEG